MRYLNLPGLLMVLLLMAAGILVLNGCDSGEKVVDKVTGNQDVKQYHKMKEDIGKISERQTKKYNDALKTTEEK